MSSMKAGNYYIIKVLKKVFVFHFKHTSDTVDKRCFSEEFDQHWFQLWSVLLFNHLLSTAQNFISLDFNR